MRGTSAAWRCLVITRLSCVVTSLTLFVAANNHTRAGDPTGNNRTRATRTVAQLRKNRPLGREIADSSSSERT